MGGVTSNTARRIRKGATLPATCSPGEAFLKTSGGSEGLYICITANTWLLLDAAAGDGTVTSVSVASANGLAGSVANPTTTPAITLSTLITGVLKGDGTAISAAVAETDYATPAAVDLKADDADVVHDTGDETIAGVKTFTSDPLIPDEAYGAGWNGSLEPPTKNAVYDKVESLGGGASYLVYEALLTQTGTDAPVATVLENTLGGTPTFSYVDVGWYHLTLADAFLAAKTVIIFQTGGGLALPILEVTRTSDSIIKISSKEGADGELSNRSLTLHVYP